MGLGCSELINVLNIAVVPEIIRRICNPTPDKTAGEHIMSLRELG